MMKKDFKQITRASTANLPNNILLKMYSAMVRIRKFEERVADLILNGKIKTPCHLYIGQEAVAVGVCFALQKDDSVLSTHRSHGHYLAKGGDMKKLMAEIYCKMTGCSQGRGGSMHVTAPEIGFLGSSAIVGGSIPLAVGVALSSSIRENNYVAVSFFGDGAVCEGVFYESLNFAALHKLPVIFVCENNFYSTHMHISKIQAEVEIYKRAKVLKIPGVRIDGNNVVTVFLETQKAIARAHDGNGPTLLECLTYRWRGHVGPSWDLDTPIRPPEEVRWWVEHCPIKILENFLMKENILSNHEKGQIYGAIEEEIEEAVRFAEESPYPEVNDFLCDVFKE